MKKNAKIIAIVIIVLLIIVASIITLFIVKNDTSIKEKEQWDNPYSEIDKNELNYKENTTVNELKEEMGLTADSDLYEVTTEYDGRKTLNIKDDILYKVAFVGIVKQSKPTLEEIDKIFSGNYPGKNGIWVSKQSREQFLQLIKENTNSEYRIEEDGYLTVENTSEQNENDKKLSEIINSNKKVIIDINSYDYEVDTITGEIVEYPFEQLDEEQTMDILTNENDKIVVITTNKNNKLKNTDIFMDLINNV